MHSTLLHGRRGSNLSHIFFVQLGKLIYVFNLKWSYHSVFGGNILYSARARARARMFIGSRLNGLLGLSLIDRTILFLVIL